MRRTSLRVVECGRCRHPEAMTMKGASWRVVDFPSLVGVIRHPVEGVILFDTGYDPAFLAATARMPERLYAIMTPVTLDQGRSAVERLAAMGIDPDDVAHIVISHFHGDHVAGLSRFPNARLHCSKAGLKDARSHGRLGRVRRGILSDLIPADIGNAAFFEGAPMVNLPPAFLPFERGADVLGDGSLVAVDLPGHCPGHWGLALRLDDDRHVMMVADAAWSITAIERNAPPPALTAAMLGDARLHRETLGALHQLRTRHADTVLLPSHCAKASTAAGLLE